jgi:hypothetical protein
MMNGPGKSDRPILPEKPSNKAGRPVAEMVEGRGLASEKHGRAKRVPDTAPDRRASCA